MRADVIYSIFLSLIVFFFVVFVISTEPRKDVTEIAQIILLSLTLIYIAVTAHSTSRAAKAAEDATKQQQESFERLEKPYFHLKNLEVIVQDDSTVFEFSIINAGKLPGTLLSYKVYFYQSGDNGDLIERGSYTESIYRPIISGLDTPRYDPYTSNITAENHWVDQEEKKLQIKVSLRYLDDLGNMHDDQFTLNKVMGYNNEDGILETRLIITDISRYTSKYI